jgi:hypothetical protein
MLGGGSGRVCPAGGAGGGRPPTHGHAALRCSRGRGCQARTALAACQLLHTVQADTKHTCSAQRLLPGGGDEVRGSLLLARCWLVGAPAAGWWGRLRLWRAMTITAASQLLDPFLHVAQHLLQALRGGVGRRRCRKCGTASDGGVCALHWPAPPAARARAEARGCRCPAAACCRRRRALGGRVLLCPRHTLRVYWFSSHPVITPAPNVANSRAAAFLVSCMLRAEDVGSGRSRRTQRAGARCGRHGAA